MSLKDTQSPWAEETLDGSFLGSGEELDLLGEILDSLSVETKSGGRLRASQSLDCCQQEASESCFSLPDIPARSPWQPDEEEQSPEPQPWSLPSLQDTPSLEEVSYSKNSCSQPSSDISSLPTAPSATSTDPSSQEDPEPSPPTELDLGTPQSPCSRLLTGPTQPGPPERPQLPGPTEANPDALWTLQSSQPPPHSSSPEDPRKYPPQVLLGHVQPLKELGALTSNSSQISNLQGFQARQPRVADLKKCFEN